MESIRQQIYDSRRLFEVKDQIAEWDLKPRHGMQKWRAHDRYGFIELTMNELEMYMNDKGTEPQLNRTSYIDWKVDENLFPKELYNLHIEEIKTYADFISSYISAVKGLNLNFIYEITFAGFHIIDSYRKHTYGRALVEAVISCFNEESYNSGKNHKEEYHTLEEIQYRMRRDS